MINDVSATRWSAALRLECARLGRAVEAGQQDIPRPILVKGPAIGRHFAEPSQRTHKDIDLLVPSSHIEYWRTFLEEHGYRRVAPKKRRHGLYFTGEIKFLRPFEDTFLMCELHTWFFAERRARNFNYEAIQPTAAQGPTGLLEPSLPSHLVILALHYRHHPPARRKEVWLRDFLELGDEEVIADARRIAADYSLEWFLERTLHEAQVLAGTDRFGAEAATPTRGFTLTNAIEKGQTGILLFLALSREFGTLQTLRYLTLNSASDNPST